MMYSYLLVSLGIVLAALVLAVFKKRWLRASLIVVIYGCLILSATFGMGGLRTQIEEARLQGKSEEFVSGMAARNKQVLSARIEVLIYASGLFVLALAMLGGTPKKTGT